MRPAAPAKLGLGIAHPPMAIVHEANRSGRLERLRLPPSAQTFCEFVRLRPTAAMAEVAAG